MSDDVNGATKTGLRMTGRPLLIRGAALAVWLMVSMLVGLLVGVLGALVIHQGLLLTVGQEGILAIDGSLVMTGLLLADCAGAIVASVAFFTLGLIGVIRKRR